MKSRTLAATALVSLVAAALPAALFAAPLDDGSSVPIAQGEAAARSCYVRAEHLWNQVMADSPRDHRQLSVTYQTFAGCAKVALTTGKVLRSGERVPWMPEYFASTVGATYAQLQLAVITSNPEHCSHLLQAKDLAEQASETEGEMDTPGNPGFESTWSTLQKNVKMQTAGCGKVAKASPS